MLEGDVVGETSKDAGSAEEVLSEKIHGAPSRLKPLVTNSRNWLCLFALLVLTLLIYSDIFISDFMAKIMPSMVKTDTNFEYQTKASGA
ncbi:hypothetical protein KDA11_05820, partial [Candidatus Saccharibacteria bacterium]|nr:hypothetical protein [Candidatus Saccharibacteria bacterium]